MRRRKQKKEEDDDNNNDDDDVEEREEQKVKEKLFWEAKKIVQWFAQPMQIKHFISQSN
jgi:hypothetical protein